MCFLGVPLRGLEPAVRSRDRDDREQDDLKDLDDRVPALTGQMRSGMVVTVAELVRELDVGFTGFRHPAILPDDAARRMPIGSSVCRPELGLNWLRGASRRRSRRS